MSTKKKQEVRDIQNNNPKINESVPDSSGSSASLPAPYPMPLPYPPAYTPYPPQAYGWVAAYDPRSFGGGFPGGGGIPGFGQTGFPMPGMSTGFPFPGFPQPGGQQPGFPQPGFPQPGGQQPGFPQPGFPQPGPSSPGMQQPTSPPPSYKPQKPFKASGSLYAVDPGAISRCLFRFTYVWLSNGQEFWYFPTFVGPNSISGFRWNGFSWMFFGLDLRFIDAFTC